jgi:NAD(P)-dependent dehydrogenase (short-subunit alcohol dehydrogenase family)
MNSLQGSVALITGAKGGLGTFVTEAFLEQGATVAGASRSIRDDDFRHPCFAAFPAELSDATAARALVEAVVNRFGRLDVLVHLIGGFAAGSVSETDSKTLDRMMDLNFRSAFYAVQAVLPVMRPQGSGRIVAIGSRAAVDANAGVGAYSASKAALVAFMRAVGAENKQHGITANVVMPGTMDTPANRAASPAADFTRWVQPGHVAGVIASLASQWYAPVSGALIPAYGGDL